MKRIKIGSSSAKFVEIIEIYNLKKMVNYILDLIFDFLLVSNNVSGKERHGRA